MPSSHPIRQARQRGAALLILVATLGLGASALLIKSFSNGRQAAIREQTTATSLAVAKEALLGYAIANGRLPRPAASATDGHEMSGPCGSENSCTGYLPWVTLGVAGSDSWGKLLRYSVSPAFTRAPVRPASAVADKKVLGRDAGGAVFFLVGQDGCDINSRCAPAVIFSNGKNNLGTSIQGMALANAGVNNQDEQRNAGATGEFFYRKRESDQTAPGGEFDDMLVWIPLQLLYRKMEAAGALPK